MANYRAAAEDERRRHGLSTGRRTPRQGGRDAALLLPTANAGAGRVIFATTAGATTPPPPPPTRTTMPTYAIGGRRGPGGGARRDPDLLLTGIRLWAQICAHLNLELRKCLITFLLFVRCQRLIARNDRELFSFNRGVLHLNNACRIDDVSRGSLSCYEILTNN